MYYIIKKLILRTAASNDITGKKYYSYRVFVMVIVPYALVMEIPDKRHWVLNGFIHGCRS